MEFGYKSAKNLNPWLQVTCAIIEQHGLVLATQRNATMSMPLKWEFPGGKIFPDELPEECLRRELREELGVEVQLVKELPHSSHRYPTFSISLHPFICSLQTTEVVLHEHAAMIWLPPSELFSLDWAEADLAVIAAYHAEKGISRP